MQRVLVGGISGAGKTTVAKRIASRFGLPFIEIDGLFHGPNWTERPEFVDDLTRLLDGPSWVIDLAGHASCDSAINSTCGQERDSVEWKLRNIRQRTRKPSLRGNSIASNRSDPKVA
ncbi:MAG TPA: shikimate kinase [Candidatus Nanopelagicaceae bacterium]|nr:shikimate kinase [Candidatus Nanopelagicaceae bacterium]